MKKGKKFYRIRIGKMYLVRLDEFVMFSRYENFARLYEKRCNAQRDVNRIKILLGCRSLVATVEESDR